MLINISLFMKSYLPGIIIIMLAVAVVSCQDDDDLKPPVKEVAKVVFNPDEVPYQTLSEYNFFEDNMADLEPGPGVLPYDVITPLFSDYAKKSRFVWMPD